MFKYIIRRLLLVIPVMLGVTILIFTLMQMIPGDPAMSILGPEAKPWELEQQRERMGLNDPFLVQMARYIYSVYIKFDVGNSYLTGISVMSVLLERIPNTLLLGLCSIVVTVAVGIPLGITAAVHQNTILDWLPLSIALVGVSMPGFWLSLMMVYVFAVILGWFPAYGMGGIQYWVLPVLSNSFYSVAYIARLTRSSLLDVINSDYITMARAKGLDERTVIYKHALPNAMIPIITTVGSLLAGILGHGTLIETIFSIPGVGYYMVRSVNNRDYPAVQGSVLILTIVFTLTICVTDLCMAAIDPRIKAQFVGTRKKKKSEEVTA